MVNNFWHPCQRYQCLGFPQTSFLIPVVPALIFNNLHFYSQKSKFIIWTMSCTVSLPHCQALWFLPCAHHILLCLPLDPGPSSVFFFNDIGALPSIGGVVQGWRPSGLGPGTLPPHVVSTRDKTSICKGKRTLIKKFLPLVIYKGLLNRELKLKEVNSGTWNSAECSS